MNFESVEKPLKMKIGGLKKNSARQF